MLAMYVRLGAGASGSLRMPAKVDREVLRVAT